MKKKEFEEKLEKLKYTPPRAGIHPTKVHKDKTKYTRKKKHKDNEKDPS